MVEPRPPHLRHVERITKGPVLIVSYGGGNKEQGQSQPPQDAFAFNQAGFLLPLLNPGGLVPPKGRQAGRQEEEVLPQAEAPNIVGAP